MEALLEEAEKAALWKFVSRLFPENDGVASCHTPWASTSKSSGGLRVVI